MKEVRKVWGKEVWLVNNDLYCAKYLYGNKGWTCSYHYHLIKRETFVLGSGEVLLTVNGSEFLLDYPCTIHALTLHQFYFLTDAVILEVSTHHDDDDVIRMKESHCGMEK